MKNKKMTGGGGATNSISSQQVKNRSLLSFVVLLLCAVVIGCAFILPLKTSAEGADSSAKVLIEELTLNGYDSSVADGKVFNGANLHKLYAAILGDDGASYEDLKERLYENGESKMEQYQGFTADFYETVIEVPYGITSEELRSENYGGNEITVLFGGIEWEVVYITTASGEKAGHVIIDLWQKDNLIKSSFSGGTGYSKPQDTGLVNPSHLYSTSYVRSHALNVGNAYYEFEGRSGELISEKGQSAQSVYAQFTMSNDALSETENAGKSLIDYIVKPSELKYQEIESWLEVDGQSLETVEDGNSYCMPNEAYGTPWKEYYYTETNSVNTGYGGNGNNKKDGYGDWKDDYLWLPSWSELSEKYLDNSINSGVWGLSQVQRAVEGEAWLRSGVYNDAGKAYCLNSYGVVNNTSNTEYFVRPALHLDLTEAEQAAKRPEPTVEVKFDIKDVLYISDGLPEPSECIATYNGVEVEGKFVWDKQTLVSGTNKYTWTFIPIDENFGEVRGEQELYFKQLTVKDIAASLKAGSKVYTLTTELELRKFLTVNLLYENGKKVETDDYYIENFDLKAGVSNELTIIYSSPDGDFVTEVIIEGVEEAAVIDLDIEFDSSSEYELYPDSDINLLKSCVTVKVKWNYKDGFETIEAENYTLKSSGKLTVGKAEIYVIYADMQKLIEPKPIVKKGTYNMSGVELVGKTEVEYDGKPHGYEIVGSLPDGVKLVSLKYVSENGKSDTKPVDVGVYEVIAEFKGDEENFHKVENITASLTILQKVYPLPHLENKQYTGGEIDFTPQFISDNFENVKLYENGVVNANCFIKKEVGKYAVTVEIISPNIIFENGIKKVELSFSITKKIIESPEYVGRLHYTGNKILPDTQDFKNFDSKIMSIISDKSQFGRDAGKYFVVIALNDSKNYTWRSDAAAMEADNNLSISEIQIDWLLERAVILASRANDKLPVIFSDSYRGSFENIIGYRYYVDEECSEGVLFADLKEGERYFVCADLIDTDNFVLDEKAEEIFSAPFSYTARTADSDLIIAVEKLSETNKAIFIAGACILGFAVLLLVALLAVVGFVIFKRFQKVNACKTEEYVVDEKENGTSAKENIEQLTENDISEPQTQVPKTSKSRKAKSPEK